MEVLNRKERLRAFLLFLLLFVITLFIVNGAVYFDYYLPWKENAELIERNTELEREFEFQKDFTRKMEQVKTHIDSINASEQDFQYYKGKAYTLIGNMEESISQEEKYLQEDMYNVVIKVTKQLIDVKGELYGLEENRQLIRELELKLQACQEQFDKAIRDLTEAKLMNKNAYGGDNNSP